MSTNQLTIIPFKLELAFNLNKEKAFNLNKEKAFNPEEIEDLICTLL